MEQPNKIVPSAVTNQKGISSNFQGQQENSLENPLENPPPYSPIKKEPVVQIPLFLKFEKLG